MGAEIPHQSPEHLNCPQCGHALDLPPPDLTRVHRRLFAAVKEASEMAAERVVVTGPGYRVDYSMGREAIFAIKKTQELSEDSSAQDRSSRPAPKVKSRSKPGSGN